MTQLWCFQLRLSDLFSSWQTHGARASLVYVGSPFGLHFYLFLKMACPIWWHEKVLFCCSARTHSIYRLAWKKVGGLCGKCAG